MSKRVLVTGGAGFIGSHLVDCLVAGGCRVTVLDDFSTGTRDNLCQACQQGDVRVIEGSILDRSTVAEAVADCELVYHLAVACLRSSLGKPIENHDVNATGTLYVLEAARRAKVSRFVYCSSSEVYGNTSSGLLYERETLCEPVTVYGASKLAGEYYTKAYYRTYGLPVIVVRPFNAYGPREPNHGVRGEVIPRFLIRILNDLPPVIFGSGENRRDFTYVTETARGLALAAQCDALVGREVNVAYGTNVSVLEVARALIGLCGRQLEPIFLAPRPGDVAHLHADTRLANELMGFRASIDLRTGLSKYVDWFGQNYPDPSVLLEDNPINWPLPEHGL